MKKQHNYTAFGVTI